MKIYQRIFFDTVYYSFHVVTAKTELEANIKAWAYLVNEVEKGRPLFDADASEFNYTFENFCETNYSYYYYRDGGTVECELVVTEI